MGAMRTQLDSDCHYLQVSPAEYPDNLASQLSYNVSELVAPNYGWANAIPGADGFVDMTVNNSRIAFQGSGYHDTVSKRSVSVNRAA
jgi:hypothetical protein